MSVVAKALALLNHFSVDCPEIGLSDLCRAAKRDKATTYRHLTALQDLGFVEQNPRTKSYRIGPAVLHLADLREATVPRRSGALAPLQTLADAIGETAHVSVLSGYTLHALAFCESNLHSTRAVIDLQTLPLHATASGLCVLAFGPPELMPVATAGLAAFTSHTAATEEQLQVLVDAAATQVFAISDRGLEADIHGLAVPVFDHTGQVAGSVAVASVSSRITPARIQETKHQLVKASQDITHNWGGRVPPKVQALWDATLTSDSKKALTS